VLVGDGGIGKTTLVRRHVTGEFLSKYIPTLGVEVMKLTFETNVGTVIFNVWDTAGQEKFGGLRDGYYVHSDGAIVMFDVTSRITYTNVPRWFADLERSCGKLPVVLVGNKVDVKERALRAHQITYHRTRGITYYDVSAKSSFNFEKPFLYLARQLTGQPDLKFVGDVAKTPAPPPKALGAAATEAIRREQALAQSIAINDEDDDL